MAPNKPIILIARTVPAHQEARTTLTCSSCAELGIHVCDANVGRGKPCNTLVCAKHATQVGPNLHVCSQHKRRAA